MNLANNSEFFLRTVLPLVCSGILFSGMFCFAYIFIRSKKKLHFFLSLTSFVSFLIVFFAAIASFKVADVEISFQLYRIKQILITSFIFLFPFLLNFLDGITGLRKKINRIVYISGAIFTSFIIFYAFAYPEYFVNVNVNEGHIVDYTEGVLYFYKDIFLIIMTTYLAGALFYDYLVNKKTFLYFSQIVCLIVFVVAILIDTYYTHSGRYLGLFPDFNFSRTTAAMTILLIFSMATVLRKFVDQSIKVEKTYDELNKTCYFLHESEERFRQLANNINEIFWITDTTGTRVLYVNPAYEKIWKRSCNSLYAAPNSWLDLVHIDDREKVRNSLNINTLYNLKDFEYRIVHNENEIRWVRERVFPLTDTDGNKIRIARVVEDVTERKKAENELTYIAYHDSLTDLLNRKAFNEKVDNILALSERTRENLSHAFLFIDIDNFKDVNDTLGHDFGDKLLMEVASRLKKVLRKSDFIFRIGGDEFTIILHKITDDLDAAKVALKIINLVSLPYVIDGNEIFIGLSVGISIYPKDGQDAITLLKHADIALYEAKKEKNTCSFYDTEMNEKAHSRIILENKLRFAVDNDELDVHYQPFFNSDGRITGMEALVRWHNEELGHVSPGDFINVAESKGFIKDIGEWVLKNACNQFRDWCDSGYSDLRLAVNVSATQFKHDGFIDTIKDVLVETGMEPSKLELEITESSVMENPEEAINKMVRLSKMGIHFSIDDFGTGYSSLSYIRKFPIRHLKIDKSFVTDATPHNDNGTLTQAIIALAHRLDLRVIAEGVELEEQKNHLADWDCDEMQGYYFSKPVPAIEFSDLLNAHNSLTNLDPII